MFKAILGVLLITVIVIVVNGIAARVTLGK